MSVAQSTFNFQQPGWVSIVNIGGIMYGAVAYRQDGAGNNVPMDFQGHPESLEKIKKLTLGLIQAHEAFRVSQNIAPYEVAELNSFGLIKKDRSVVSHDFNVQNFSVDVAQQMATFLSATDPHSPETIKGDTIWNNLERVMTQDPNSPPNNTVRQNPLIQRLAVELDLRNFDFTQPNWYDLLPLRQKYRIIDDILEHRAPRTPAYQKVWQYFERKSRELLNTTINDLLTRERTALTLPARSQPSAIASVRRSEAETLIQAYRLPHPNVPVQTLIQNFMANPFNQKDALFNYLYQQAIAEGVIIQEWDHQWAEHHYAECPHRFIQALIRWLDNV